MQLAELMEKWFTAFSKAESDRQSWEDTISTITRKIWEPLVAPLIDHLKAANYTQAILVPTGFTSLLPLHAAWTEDIGQPTHRRYALDDIHFTYLPSAKALNISQLPTQNDQFYSLLAIDDPEQNLKYTKREIDAAVKITESHKVLRHTEATVEAVKSHLREATVAHFACHGDANLTDPLSSGLVMHDGVLTLKEIFSLNLAESFGLRLVILSACATGLQGINNVDEAVSLPTGLIQAGVCAVIASLWSISDFSTMILLNRFYDLWREETLLPAQALRKAQIWLRDSTEGEIATYMGFHANSPTKRSYAHPFHWAAFSYTGI